MKILLCLATIVVAIHSQGVFESYIAQQWQAFKAFYGKFYPTAQEEQARFKAFSDNLDRVTNHNNQYRMGNVPYSLDINKYSDLSPEQHVGRLSGFKMSPIQTVAGVQVHLGRVPTDFRPPTYLDYRNTYVSPVVADQGECASDWAFVAAASLEGQYAVRSNNIVPLSAQNLLDCSGGIYGNQGCRGGNMVRAFQYFVANGGIASEASYGYTGRTDICRFNPNNRSPTGFYVYAIPPTEDDVKTYLVLFGPVAAAIDASDYKFQLYNQGVYDSRDCSPLRINHAVLIVGYGDETDNFQREHNYWLVKNSWGNSWGEAGYFKIERNTTNVCGLSYFASIATQDNLIPPPYFIS